MDFDLIVIGAGSGGIAAAVRASKLGAKVLLIDKGIIGGTCVNVGCIPKKVMWYASHLADMFARAPSLGFDAKFPNLDWEYLIKKRNEYISRIHVSYGKTFEKHNITYIEASAKLISKNEVQAGDKHYKANHIIIATGSTPLIPRLPGAQHGITSDGFFELNAPPRNVAVIGAGYIAVELSGILQRLGSRVNICVRTDTILRNFDPFISKYTEQFLEHQGVYIQKQFTPMMIERQHNEQFCLVSDKEQRIHDLDCIIWAIGRTPNTKNIGLEDVGVEMNDNGIIVTDVEDNTTVDGIYALGDITHHKHLTPVAIRSGRRLAERLFGNATLPLDDDLIPSIIFSHPPIGTMGLSEPEAKEKFGDNQVKVYETEFKSMFEWFMKNPIPFGIKLVTQGDDEHVVGCHIAGPNSDEMLQGFAVAMQMGATKQDFDNTIAIHPTSSEELVLL